MKKSSNYLIASTALGSMFSMQALAADQESHFKDAHPENRFGYTQSKDHLRSNGRHVFKNAPVKNPPVKNPPVKNPPLKNPPVKNPLFKVSVSLHSNVKPNKSSQYAVQCLLLLAGKVTANGVEKFSAQEIQSAQWCLKNFARGLR